MNKLNAITLIEEFFVNALLASPDVPLDVNVLRLADTTEQEGTVVFPKSITVRFTGSNTQTVHQQPLIIQRTMDYELEISCQNHQSNSGHDYATYLLGACARTLLNRVPFNTGLNVIGPLTLERESFSGLTESGHFVYVQTWSLTIEEAMPSLPIDPCVARGKCSEYGWGGGGYPPSGDTILEGEVLVSPNGVYHLKPPEGYDCLEFGGTFLANNGDLATVFDPTVVYLTEAQRLAGVTYITQKMEDTTDVLVTARGSDGINIRSDLFCYTGRTVMGLYMFLNNRGGAPEKVLSLFLPYAKQAVVFRADAKLYVDPRDTEETPSNVAYGKLVFVDPNITLNVGDVTYVRTYLPQSGLAWITGGTYRIISEVFCEDAAE